MVRRVGAVWAHREPVNARAHAASVAQVLL
jgi:hypothetical protein